MDKIKKDVHSETDRHERRLQKEGYKKSWTLSECHQELDTDMPVMIIVLIVTIVFAFSFYSAATTLPGCYKYRILHAFLKAILSTLH